MVDFKHIALAEIKADPNQPRKVFDDLAMQELTASVKEKGVLQPILIRPNGKGFILVCGERRFRAATSAGLKEVPAVIRELNDDEALELQIIENLQRKDVHPLEEAVAFKSLVENKTRPLPVEEVAAKVGKSVFFVRQRMRLNTLIAEWQDVFYKNKIHVTIALSIAQIPEKDQKQLHDQKVNKKNLSDPNYFPSISNHDLDSLQRKLKTAPFDTKDTTLNPKMGACTSCPFNSAVASLFPEEAKDPICNSAPCYTVKCVASFDRLLKVAKEDPAVLLVKTWSWDSTDTNRVERLEKEGHKVLTVGSDCREINAKGEELKKGLESGKFHRAFFVAGDNRGKSIHVEIVKKHTAGGKDVKKPAELIKEGKATAAVVEEEISRINDREKRSKELDAQKVWEQVSPLVSDLKNLSKVPFDAVQLNQVEKNAAAYALLEECGMEGRKKAAKVLGFATESFGFWPDMHHAKKMTAVTDKQLSHLLRLFFIDKLNKGVSHAQSAPALMLMSVLRHEHYMRDKVNEIEAAQKELSEKRIAKVNSRLKSLQEMKKDLSKPKPAGPSKAAKKAAPKKAGKKVVKKAAKKK
jgi:ParB family chromosome partitioning protein